jgi:hypothetical protein
MDAILLVKIVLGPMIIIATIVRMELHLLQIHVHAMQKPTDLAQVLVNHVERIVVFVPDHIIHNVQHVTLGITSEPVLGVSTFAQRLLRQILIVVRKLKMSTLI